MLYLYHHAISFGSSALHQPDYFAGLDTAELSGVDEFRCTNYIIFTRVRYS